MACWSGRLRLCSLQWRQWKLLLGRCCTLGLRKGGRVTTDTTHSTPAPTYSSACSRLAPQQRPSSLCSSPRRLFAPPAVAALLQSGRNFPHLSKWSSIIVASEISLFVLANGPIQVTSTLVALNYFLVNRHSLPLGTQVTASRRSGDACFPLVRSFCTCSSTNEMNLPIFLFGGLHHLQILVDHHSVQEFFC